MATRYGMDKRVLVYDIQIDRYWTLLIGFHFRAKREKKHNFFQLDTSHTWNSGTKKKWMWREEKKKDILPEGIMKVLNAID